VFAAEKVPMAHPVPKTCTRSVQGWKVEPGNFSDINVRGTFN